GAIQTGLVHIFQKRLGRSGELENAVEIGLMLSHQLQRGRAQHQLERLNMDVAVSDQSLPGTSVPGFPVPPLRGSCIVVDRRQTWQRGIPSSLKISSEIFSLCSAAL